MNLYFDKYNFVNILNLLSRQIIIKYKYIIDAIHKL